MNKKYKLIFLILFSFLITGCKASYELVINDDLSVVEKISATTTQNELDEYTKYESYYEVINGIYENSSYAINTNSFFEYVDKNNVYGGNVVTTYDTFENYIKNSEAIHEVFNTITYNANDNVINVETSDYFNIGIETSYRSAIDELNVNIISPFKIESNNFKCKIKGDKYNCVAKINSNQENIDLSFEVQTSTKAIFYYLIFIISGIIVLAFVLYAFVRKIKSVNEI